MAGETILVVDDSREMLESVGGALMAAGYRVVFAADGEEGLEKFAEVDPDLVVTDIFMPQMSGLELGDRLREIGCSRRIPILAMSGMQEYAGGAPREDLHADDFLEKPFHKEELLKRVRALLDRHAADSQPAADVPAARACALIEKKPLRLLLVEDNDEDAHLLLRALRMEGFAVTHRKVESAPQMTAALDTESWDAIVSDYSLPAFSAPAALELYRRHGLDIPFIVVSGAVGEEIAAKLMKEGASDYISKSNFARLGPALARELTEAEGRRRQRQTEIEREQLEAQFIQAQKMEAIGVLTAGVAHDFNNLLGAIQIYVDLAQMKVGPDSVIEKELRQIMGITDRAAGLIRQLMLFSRKQPLTLEPFDLNTTTTSLLKMLGRFIGERITVETDLASDLPAVMGDVGGIEQLIMNLAVNARDAMPEGGTLRIATRVVDLNEAESQHWPAGRPGRFALLSIQDTGIGMDADTARRIYEPFFTTKEAGKGTGLGLSVVFGIVKQHQGWINLESAVGAGTRFEIYLPLAEKQSAEDRKAKVTLTEFRGAGDRLLLVEDEEGLRCVTAEALRANGYLVDEASGVQQARELLEATSACYDLAVIDVVLGDGDGFDLAQEISGRHPKLRLLLITGYTDDHSRLPAIRECGLPLLAKPFSLSGLLTVLRKVLAARSVPEEGEHRG